MRTADQIEGRIPAIHPTGQVGDDEAMQHFRTLIGDATKGTIQRSNDALGDDPEEASREQIAAAKVAFKFRASQSDEAKANKACLGGLLDGFSGSVAEYMRNIERGMDLGTVMDGVTRGIAGSASYNTGGKIDQIQQDVLTIFSEYATSPQALKYFKETTKAISPANVFGGSEAEALNFMVLSVLNTAGPVYGAVRDQGEDAMQIMQECVRTMLYIPNFLNADQAGLAKLPEKFRPLVLQYQGMIQSIWERMNQLPD